jgi:hypothetical protein
MVNSAGQLLLWVFGAKFQRTRIQREMHLSIVTDTEEVRAQLIAETLFVLSP